MQDTKGRDNLLAYILCLLIYVPSSSIGNIVRIGIIGGIFIIKLRIATDYHFSRTARRMIISPFIPLLFVLAFEGGVNRAVVIHEIMRMVFCALMVLSATKMKVSFQCVYRCCVIALIPNLFIQVLQRMGNSYVTSIIISYYSTGYEGTFQELLKDVNSASFRSGSIFFNPNVLMVIPLLSMVVFLQRDRRKPSVLNYFLIACCGASCMLTGSRTSTVVAVIILGLYMIRYASVRSKVSISILVIILIARFGVSFLQGSRALNINLADIDDSSDSLAVKINQFAWYWRSTKSYILYWVSGSLGSRIAYHMDSEIGHIYAWFGLFGISWYFGYLKSLLNRNSTIPFYSRPITYVCGLVSLTASVLLCMPIFSFVGLLSLSNIEEG